MRPFVGVGRTAEAGIATTPKRPEPDSMTAPLASLPSPVPSPLSAVAPVPERGDPPATAESLATSGTRSTSSSVTAGPVPADTDARDARTSEPSPTGSCAPAPDTDQRSAARQTTTARPAHARRRRIACRCAVVGRSTALPLAMGATLVHVPAAGTQRAPDPPTVWSPIWSAPGAARTVVHDQ